MFKRAVMPEARAALAPEMSRNSPCRGGWRWGAPHLHSADRPSLVRHPLRPFPRQLSCAHDANSGLGGVHLVSPVAIEIDEQFIRDRTQTRTRTRTSAPFLAWVGFSQLKHAYTRPAKLPGDKTVRASPIPTLASISTSLRAKELGRAEWPLSVKVSVNWGADELFAINPALPH